MYIYMFVSSVSKIDQHSFLKNVVCSHKMTYRNDVNDPSTPHNKSGYISKTNMDKMWQWISPAFKKSNILNFSSKTIPASQKVFPP